MGVGGLRVGVARATCWRNVWDAANETGAWRGPLGRQLARPQAGPCSCGVAGYSGVEPCPLRSLYASFAVELGLKAGIAGCGIAQATSKKDIGDC